MLTAAIIAFAILLVAWIAAPAQRKEPRTMRRRQSALDRPRTISWETDALPQEQLREAA
jgi:hypothetical protein